MVELFYCYSVNLKRHLMDKGHRYITVGISAKTKKTYWLFEKTDEVKKEIDWYFSHKDK